MKNNTKLENNYEWNQYKHEVDQGKEDPKLRFGIFFILMLLYLNHGFVGTYIPDSQNHNPVVKSLLNLGLVRDNLKYRLLKDSDTLALEFCSLTSLGRKYVHNSELNSDFKEIAPHGFGYTIQLPKLHRIPITPEIWIICISFITLLIGASLMILNEFVGFDTILLTGSAVVNVPTLLFMMGEILGDQSDSLWNNVVNELRTDSDYHIRYHAKSVFKSHINQNMNKTAFVDLISKNPTFKTLINKDKYNQIINTINHSLFCYTKDNPDPMHILL